MITRIHNIRGVGRFRDFECKQGIELGKLTLIYSENGQGKSTLADIFRSLADGDEARLLGRKTVGATNQFVKLETEDGITCFHNGSWNQSFSDILVFDEIFVNDNVYEGLTVRPDHRENLHPIIVGDVQKRGVQQEEDLVATRKTLGDARSEVEKRIKSVRGNVMSNAKLQFTVDDFVRLDKVENVAARIATQRGIVAQLRDSHRIISESKFKNIDALELPIDELRALLNKKLSGIADDAKAALQDHVDRFSGNEMKTWLRKGTKYTRDSDDTCPFCGQSLKCSHMIEHYLAIFEETYESFEAEVSAFSSRKLDFANWLTSVKSGHEFNQGRSFWAEHIPDLEVPSLDVDLVNRALAQVKAEMEVLLTAKENALFKTVDVSPALKAALSRWAEVWRSVETYSNAISAINSSIDELRTTTDSGSLTDAEHELAKLLQTEVRYRDDVAPDCESYMTMSQELTDLAKQLEDQRKTNADAIERTFAEYGSSLDRYLNVFGANFRIKDLVQTRVRGVLRADYNLGLSGETIALGKQDADISQRSFRNVLSEGDKRSLAMAFFLSRIDQMNDIEDKIIVFDDPVTSMDDSRRNKTVLEIGRLAKPSKQVFVLSHRPEFLHSLWYRFCRHGDGQIGSTQLEIRGVKDSSTLLTWNMEATVASLHAKRIRRVLEYHNDESDRDEDEISGELRPLLDYHYKIHYPEIFERHNISTIGEFARILDPNSLDPVVKVLATTDKAYLARLNKVHRETMHGQDPPPEPLTRTELKSDCAIVLNLLGRREIQLNGVH